MLGISNAIAVWLERADAEWQPERIKDPFFTDTNL